MTITFLFLCNLIFIAFVPIKIYLTGVIQENKM